MLKLLCSSYFDVYVHPLLNNIYKEVGYRLSQFFIIVHLCLNLSSSRNSKLVSELRRNIFLDIIFQD